MRTASIQRTNNVPPIDFAIEIVHFQPPRETDNLLSLDNRQNACPKEQVAVQNPEPPRADRYRRLW